MDTGVTRGSRRLAARAASARPVATPWIRRRASRVGILAVLLLAAAALAAWHSYNEIKHQEALVTGAEAKLKQAVPLVQEGFTRDPEKLVRARALAAGARSQAAEALRALDGDMILGHTGWVPFVGDQVNATRTFDRMAWNAADAATRGIDVLADIRHRREAGSSLVEVVGPVYFAREKDINTVADDILAEPALWSSLDRDKLVGPLRTAYDKLASPMRAVGSEIIDVQLIREGLPRLLGRDKPTHFLVLLADNAELRPGGGFFGSYAVVGFDHGKYLKPTPRDIYLLEDPLKQNPDFLIGGKHYTPPPGPLLRAFDTLDGHSLYLRDASWSPQWEENARQAEALYQVESGQAVDGLIQVDLGTIDGMLKILGPIKVAGYPEPLTPRNFVQITIGQTRVQSTHKAFLGPLQAALMDRLNSLPPSSWPALVSYLRFAIQSRDLLMHMNDRAADALIRAHNFDGILPPCSQDCLMVVYGNIGGTKSDIYMKRSVDIKVDAASGNHHVDVTLTNLSPQVKLPKISRYGAYVRFYVPAGATFSVPAGYSDLGSELGMRVLGREITVLAGQTLHLVIDYKTPPITGAYDFVMPRQPGGGREFLTLSLNAPGRVPLGQARLEGTTITWTSNHASDFHPMAAPRGS